MAARKDDPTSKDNNTQASDQPPGAGSDPVNPPKLDPVLESDKAHAAEGISSAHLSAADDLVATQKDALYRAWLAQEEAKASGHPVSINVDTLVAQGAFAAAANANRFTNEVPIPPGYTRVPITNAFAMQRADGSTVKFRPDGTNCNIPGVYDVLTTDVVMWPEMFGNKSVPPADQTDTPEGMKRVRVMASFVLNRTDGTSKEYKANGTNCGLPGYYDMAPDDADHWMTQGCSDTPPEQLPAIPGTQRFIEEEARRQARLRLIEAALDQEEEQAKAQVRDSRALRLRKVLGSAVEVSGA